MVRRMILSVLCVLPFALVGCAEKAVSPEELISTLQASGCQVTREERIHHTVRGADVAFWVRIDGARVSAWQFKRRSQAEFASASMVQGFVAGSWAFEYADPVTAEKIKRALQ